MLFAQIGHSQSTEITGTIVDAQNEPLELASIALLNPKDSTFINYTVTNEKGYFKISTTKRNPFILQASFLGYLPYSKNINPQGKTIDLKTIQLIEDSNTLDAVVISAVVPIRIKKDTLEFNANAFKVNHDDTIESLLKKLPGIEVDSDGKVIAQGNEVQRIFVDGKEFFGGDPAIVLKNLSADAILKVEVVDKKSDEAELTGVDDGNKEVIINFSLKKTRKNQGFGKLATGVGLDQRYFSNLNYNRFNPKTQLSVIGKFNNINVTGSNIRGFLQNANGIADDSDEENNTNQVKSLSGYLTTGVSGVHIGHEFKKKESFNADYFYNHSNNNGLTNSNRVTFSGNNNFNINSDNHFNNTSNNHNFNFNYKNKSSKVFSLIMNGRFALIDRNSILNRNAKYINSTNELATTNDSDFQNYTQRKSGRFSINYHRKLSKPGRSFSTNVNTSITNNLRENEQDNLITRNIGKTNQSEREIFTLRDQKTTNKQLNFILNYTEPLIKYHYLKIQGSARIKNDIDNTFQSKTTITSITQEEDFSYTFKSNEYSYQTKLSHSYVTKKWNINTGVALQDLNRLFGEGLHQIPKNQFYANPSTSFLYRPKRGERHQFTYNRLIRSPRIAHINTVKNDLNPYSIRVGNPNLRTEKVDQFRLTNTVHKFKSSLSFYSRIQYQYINDAIVSNVTIDDNYIKTRSYENKGQAQRLNTTLSLSQKINKLGVRYTLKSTNFYTTSNALVNLELNTVTSQDNLYSLTIENYNKSTFDIKAGVSYNRNNTSFSLMNDLDRIYSQQQYFSMFDYQVSKKLNINTQFDYLHFKDNTFSDNQELLLWNAAISYSLSKNKKNIFKLVLIDILDKNIDIYRRSTINYFEETKTQSLGRYIILSYTYKLNNNQQKKKKRS